MTPRKYARSETMTPGFNRTIEICLEHLDLGPQTRVLDVPCGKGEAIVRLAPSGCRTIGLDRSSQLLMHAATKLGRAHVSNRSRVLLSDGGRMPFGDETFDVCLSIGGPSCIAGHSVRAALAEQTRVLRPGGFLVMSDMFRSDADPNPWIGPDHPDADGWTRLLEDVRLQIVHFEHFPVSAWDEYHAPMRELIAEVRRDHAGDTERMDWATNVESEIAMDLPSGRWANYGTFVTQKNAQR
jgi:cyclopropane fatty-acyl-phospholipid synthase-like methyltransferase